MKEYSKRLISIIVPIYNCADYLAECLESITNQTRRDIEIICVNDCSTDTSADIIEKYSSEDKRIVVINHDQNQGLSVSRNDGIAASNGEFILFVDADDYITSDMVEKLYEIAKAYDTDMLGFGFDVEYEDETLIGKLGSFRYRPYATEQVTLGRDYYVMSDSAGAKLSPSWAYLYKASFLKNKGLKFEPGLIYEDELFYLQSVLAAQRVFRIDSSLYHYRRRVASITSGDGDQVKKIFSLSLIAAKIERVITDLDYDTDVKLILRRQFSSLCLKIKGLYEGIDSFEKGELDEVSMTYPIFVASVAGCYDGCFLNKLTSEDMTTIRSAQHVFIYGAGKVGHAMAKLLAERQIDHYEFVVSEKAEAEKKPGVLWIEDVRDYLPDAVVIVAMKRDQDIAVRSAQNAGARKIIVPEM